MTSEQGPGPGVAGALRELETRAGSASAEGPLTILESVREIGRLARSVYWQARKIRHLLSGSQSKNTFPDERYDVGPLDAQIELFLRILRTVEGENGAILRALDGPLCQSNTHESEDLTSAVCSDPELE